VLTVSDDEIKKAVDNLLEAVAKKHAREPGMGVIERIHAAAVESVENHPAQRLIAAIKPHTQGANDG